MKLNFKRSLILISLIFILFLSFSFVYASNSTNEISDMSYIYYDDGNAISNSDILAYEYSDLDVSISNEDLGISLSNDNLALSLSYEDTNSYNYTESNSNNDLNSHLEKNKETSSKIKSANSNSNFKDIQSLIDNAKEGDTIELSGIYTGDSQIMVNKSINIVSHTGATLDGGFLCEIMLINASNLILENINFISSNYTGLEIKANHITIQNCSFDGCINGELGSALKISGNDINVLNSNFTNNVANKSSCHHTDGAAIYLIGNNCNISNCNFENNFGFNYETASSGGAIWLKGTNINIINSTFTNNSAQALVGWTLHGEEITYLADGFGGSIYLVGSKINIISSVFKDSLSHAYGGALYYKSCTDCSIINSSFINSFSVGDGGAIYLSQNVFGLNIDSCTFINNTADGLDGVLVKYTDLGSVIYSGKYTSDLRIVNSSLLNNKGSFSVYFLGSNLNVSNSIIKNFNSSAISYTNGSLNHNFWASNFESQDEFKDSALIVRNGENQAPDLWFNLKIDGFDSLNLTGSYVYDLNFVLKDNSSGYYIIVPIINNSYNPLPDYSIQLKTKTKTKNFITPENLILRSSQGDFIYNCIESAKDSILLYDDYGNLIVSKNILSGIAYINDTGNDTKDLQDAIDNANPGSLIILLNKTYVLDTITIDKSIKIAGDGNSSIRLSNSSDCIFKIMNSDSDISNDDFSILDIGFLLDNGDIVVLAEAENDSNPLAIDIPSINILNNTFTSLDDGVVSKSITVLQVDSSRLFLAPTNSISIHNNSLESGMNPFVFNVRSIVNGSDVSLDALDILDYKKGTEIIYKDMTTNAIASSADPRSGEYFNVVLKDDEGNPLANKRIQIGFNGKIYNRTSNESGGVKLQINLPNKGTYTFAISFLGDEIYNGSFAVAKIVVNTQKPIVSLNDVKYKLSSKSKTISLSFKSMKGTAVSGKKITFTLNGKTYSAKTNSKGVASVKVSLNKKGTYKFTAKFQGDNTFSAVTKTAKIVIV